ncbi:NYN domain-containing protein [Fuscibacter oryzae]|uniref:NYN domain-containing protein n=1 Tax=Fuscibacter oryzae TaxID=2803939 RepID=A0A8J7MTH6_9RHOB|nr:NYN domain-containing protein [Fuscibacter oryzae]MBL4929291.1 NYN domain-containing protein [Fuscibacter oryzae]
MTFRIALLVDGDNVSARYMPQIMQIAAQSGRVDVARVYGNAQTARGWSDCDGFRFIHSGTGKNATDLLLTIDAMELALTAGIEGFVLVSSDGDFKPLSERLRDHGMCVTGIGEAKTPSAFRAACTAFHQLGSPAPKAAPKLALVAPSAKPAPSMATLPQPDDLYEKIRDIIVESAPETKGMMIARLAAAMHARHQVRISKYPEKNWRRYLQARPKLFDLDPKGPDAKVRLQSEDPCTSLRLVKS